MRKVLISFINCYRKYISANTTPVCRYIPTCSEYAIECLNKYNIFKASLKIIFRIIRCNPFCKGGIDPS